ncbi:site-specific DNA-methyltransferase [Aeromonas caviae]|nr:site-specific DNA-methyltransferase [Aeromonas caviae]MBL0587523.1 site-specific DNA-methyltransferase [Aeromonas caviae]MEB5774346.1 site-specific DNA-methyltransferase [Aeromonas caviae]MEB6649482.1 site-specific DNA-methyltransferase [Aeromonas caviae]
MKKKLESGFEINTMMENHDKNIKCVHDSFSEAFSLYQNTQDCSPLLMCGDALQLLSHIPSDSIDFIMTSPPYWGKREYENGGIGLETEYMDFVRNLADICLQIKRVLKPTGSFWLNLGDTYKDKALLGLPWRVAFELTDNQGWILRNSVIWNKLKGGMDNSTDRLGNVHENIFHFVKKSKGYYYNVDAIRTKPRDAKIVNGSVVSATGVSGVRYKRQIELSTALDYQEKLNALSALNSMLDDIASGKYSDFRMVIRGQQRTTHSESEKVSGRAKELRDKGFYFLRYHPNGSKPADVWDILPEDTQKRKSHFAAYPLDLCRIPILATCPSGGIVLDPFSGTGSTLITAYELGRKSVGIDISESYLELTRKRFGELK